MSQAIEEELASNDENNSDEEIVRPKLLPSSVGRKHIRHSMLHEIHNLNLEPQIQSKSILEKYKGMESENNSIVANDIHEQETSFKIRLLKRQNKVYGRKLTIDPEFSFWNESSISNITDKEQISSFLSFD